ncbi:MAG UNVERIFIED_CONTAM: hypothetical protein MIJ72_10730, partial [Staphylococcus saprophyticus]
GELPDLAAAVVLDPLDIRKDRSVVGLASYADDGRELVVAPGVLYHDVPGGGYVGGVILLRLLLYDRDHDLGKV